MTTPAPPPTPRPHNPSTPDPGIREAFRRPPREPSTPDPFVPERMDSPRHHHRSLWKITLGICLAGLTIAAVVGMFGAVNVVLERGDRLARQDRVNDQLRAEVADLQGSLKCIAGKSAAYDVALGDSVAEFESALVRLSTDRASVDYVALARTAAALKSEVESRRKLAEANPPVPGPATGSATLCAPAPSAPNP